MAEYAIRLNLGGNANTRLAAFNRSLDATIRKSTQLSGVLATLDKARVPMTGREQTRLARLQKETEQIRLQTTQIRAQTNALRQKNAVESRGNQRRRNNQLISWSVGTNVLGGRVNLSRFLTQDGKILGMDANKVGIGAAITAAVGSAIKTALKTVAFNTVAPLAIAGGGLAVGMNMLRSERFAQGNQLIARRRQAQLGLGMADAERAMRSADFLAASYGFDRSAALSSINVLTGAGIGGSPTRRISAGQASRLTQIGGFISQQNGASFERVMTNIQQLLVQANPNIRDIRELLNQAPILQKYAMRDMEARGVNTDVRTYLKNQDNVMSVLERYAQDNVSTAGMRARGQIELATQDMWAAWAGNNPFWQMIGARGSGLINAFGNGANNLMTTLANDPTFSRITKQLELTVTNLGSSLPKIFIKIEKFFDKWGQILGLELAKREEVNAAVLQENSLKYFLGDSGRRTSFYNMWSNTARAKALAPDLRMGAFDDEYSRFISDVQANNPGFYVSGIGNQIQAGAWGTFNDARQREKLKAGIGVLKSDANTYVPDFTGKLGSDMSNLKGGYMSYGVNNARLNSAFMAFLGSQGGTSSLITTNTTNASGAGDDLSGFNRDRRSLTINFNNAIAEITNNIRSGDPREVAQQVYDRANEEISRGIQIALLGATEKMNSTF